MRTWTVRILTAAVLAVTLSACGLFTPVERQTIAEIAVANENLSTLVAALQAADLVDTFADAEGGPFTVFAPTDAAFEALPAGVLDALLADPAALAEVLTYHVAESRLLFNDVAAASAIPTLNGIAINPLEGGLDGYAGVVSGDIIASNGVVHVIDAVLLPKDVVDVAVTDGRFTTLVAALTQEGLVETLRGDGPFTVFAPTDDAFAAALTALDLTTEELLARDDLTDILLYHVVAGSAIDAATVIATAPNTVGTVQGGDIAYEVVDGGVVLNGSVNVVITDVQATNGIIHAIDFVLLPPAAPTGF